MPTSIYLYPNQYLTSFTGYKSPHMDLLARIKGTDISVTPSQLSEFAFHSQHTLTNIDHMFIEKPRHYM